MSIADKLAEYDGLLNCKSVVCKTEHTVRFCFYNQDNLLLFQSEDFSVSYQDFTAYRRFPAEDDQTTYQIRSPIRGTCNRISIYIHASHGEPVCENLTLSSEVIKLAPGNTLTITPSMEGFIHVAKIR